MTQKSRPEDLKVIGSLAAIMDFFQTSECGVEFSVSGAGLGCDMSGVLCGHAE